MSDEMWTYRVRLTTGIEVEVEAPRWSNFDVVLRKAVGKVPGFSYNMRKIKSIKHEDPGMTVTDNRKAMVPLTGVTVIKMRH